MSAPTSAEKDVPIDPTPKMIATATPKLAPELIPRIEGPAKGLENNICKSNPETASNMPQKSVAKLRGIRIEFKITSSLKKEKFHSHAIRCSAKRRAKTPSPMRRPYLLLMLFKLFHFLVKV